MPPTRRTALRRSLRTGPLARAAVRLATVTLAALALAALPACTGAEESTDPDDPTDDPTDWPTSETVALCDELFSADPNGLGEEARMETWTECVTCGVACGHPCRFTLSLRPTFSCEAKW